MPPPEAAGRTGAASPLFLAIFVLYLPPSRLPPPSLGDPLPASLRPGLPVPTGALVAGAGPTLMQRL